MPSILQNLSQEEAPLPGIQQVHDDLDHILSAIGSDPEAVQFYENKLVNVFVIDSLGRLDIEQNIQNIEKVLKYLKGVNRTKKLVIPLKRVSQCKNIKPNLHSIIYQGVLMFYLKNGDIDFRQILSVIEMGKKVDAYFGNSEELKPYQNLFMDHIKTEFKTLMERSEPEGD